MLSHHQGFGQGSRPIEHPICRNLCPVAGLLRHADGLPQWAHAVLAACKAVHAQPPGCDSGSGLQEQLQHSTQDARPNNSMCAAAAQLEMAPAQAQHQGVKQSQQSVVELPFLKLLTMYLRFLR